MTRSKVSRVRWFTATEDAKSIHSSLASGGGEAGRTYYTAGNFNRAQGMNVAAPAKTALLYFASNEPDNWVAKIGIAQSITDPIQAQCHSKGQRIFLPFRSEERREGKEGRSRWSPYH